jgi:hypothetical protein
MLLSNFNSIFELLAAFNFAYVISDSFNDHLHTRIIHGFVNIEKNLDNIGGKIKIGMDSLHACKPFTLPSGKSSDEKIEQVKTAMNAKQAQFSTLNKDVRGNIRIAGLRESFKFICLYAALYALSVLVFIGFATQLDSPHNSVVYQAIGILNFFYMVFLLCALQKEKILFDGKRLSEKKAQYWYNQIGYRFTFIWFFISLFLALSYFFLDKYILLWYCHWRYFEITTVSLCLVLPSIHFFLYLFKAYSNVIKFSPVYKAQIDEFELDWENFYRLEVQPVIHMTQGINDLENGL